MPSVNFDPHYFDCCTIDTEEFIQGTLGEPLPIPKEISDALYSDWAIKSDEKLKSFFEKEAGKEYELMHRDNSYNYQSDLDAYFVYSIYCPNGSGDWLWSQDTYIVIEMSLSGGDPRGANYSSGEVYYLPEGVAESGFLDWMISWHLEPMEKTEGDEHFPSYLEKLTTDLSAGNTGNPTHKLRELLKEGFEPEWNGELQCYTGFVKGYDREVKMTPLPPWFG